MTEPAIDPEDVFEIGTMAIQVMGTALPVADLRRSFDFYSDGLGMVEVTIAGVPRPDIDDPDAEGKIMMNFTASPAHPMVTLVRQRGGAPGEEVTRLTTIGLKVADVRATIDRVRGLGATVDLEVTGFRGALVGIARDPDGYGLEIVQAPSVGDAGAGARRVSAR